jgi:anthranilate phosphoribosyltransferase
MLNMAILQKQQAISTLMALQLRGVTMEEITGLTKILIWIDWVSNGNVGKSGNIL